MQCVDETRDSHQEIENPQVFSLMKEGENIVESIDVTAPAFVLVEAKSIDEAMNTSLDSVEDGDKEEESYSHALQSLLVREPIVSRYVEEEKEETQPQPLFTEMVFISGENLLEEVVRDSVMNIPCIRSYYRDSFWISIL